MAYSELIKDFQRIRDYMRQFYVYGFKSREEYTAKSARSYDNERRRVVSWLGEYMFFRRSPEGKNVFLSVDSRSIPQNPLYKAFRSKSFTDKDIALHFFLLDLLSDKEGHTAGSLADAIEEEYLSHFDIGFSLDESTLRKKLKEYCVLGLAQREKQGRDVLYRLSSSMDLSSWQDAIAFFTEASPLGVVGSYFQAQGHESPGYYSFKHHYLLHALDSDILASLFETMREKLCADITIRSLRSGLERDHRIFPMRLYISVQSGREYLLCYHYRFRKPTFFRIDSIIRVQPGPPESHWEKYEAFYPKFASNLWGVSPGSHSLDHVEALLRISPDEGHILQRLHREGRVGRIEAVDSTTYRYTADIYDAEEMLPWLRTFLGRILSFTCTNAYVQQKFYDDLKELDRMYGGEDNAV